MDKLTYIYGILLVSLSLNLAQALKYRLAIVDINKKIKEITETIKGRNND